MEKFAESFKAIIAVFHGIIATWLFLQFSENRVDEFHFVILLVFFSVANVLIWNACRRVARRRSAPRRLGTHGAAPLVDFEHATYRLSDGIGLTIIAIAVGLLAAYADKHEWILRAGNQVNDWQLVTNAPPFEYMLTAVEHNRPWKIDVRPRAAVDAARQKGAYLRVYVKDSKLGYEGFPSNPSTKGEVVDREAVLSPACRFFTDSAEPTKMTGLQKIEGPGVFLRLNDVVAIEIIDAHQSSCAKLFDAP